MNDKRCFTFLMADGKGEKKKQEEKDEHHHPTERYYGSFQHSFHVPVNIKTDKRRGVFDREVITVTLPKSEEAKKNELEVEVK